MSRWIRMGRFFRGGLAAAATLSFLGGCEAEDSGGYVGDRGLGAMSGGVGGMPPANANAGAMGTPSVTGSMDGTGGVGAMGVTGGTGGMGMNGGVGGVDATGGVGGMAATGGTGGMDMTDGAWTSAATDPDCDISGLWAVRDLSIVQALDLEQCGNIYHYIELAQQGTDVEIVNHFNCAIEGRGSANSTMNDATVKSMISTNSMIGRRGTMMKGADGLCHFELEPWWMAFGVDESMYTPDPRNSPMSLSELQSTNPLPMLPAGASDPDGDGQPGIAIIVAGAINGTRHITQRVRTTWQTDARYTITPATDWTTLEIGNRGQPEEYTVATTPPNDFLLMAPALPVLDSAAQRVTMRFLGRTADASGIVVSSDPADLDGALATCRNIADGITAVVPLAFPNPQVCPCPDGSACQ
ncbi:MAG: hypothetical protein OXT09_14330 [Myxococcales bacterium]|nr:hypothetical protein [Myxococcales bacterium]